MVQTRHTDYLAKDYGNVKEVYNAQKGRIETWVKCPVGDNEWALYDAQPARVWQDKFITGAEFFTAVLGLQAQIPWAINGRRNGPGDPDATCFAAVHQIGGGVELIANTGGANDDYTAIHFGSSYPIAASHSPHVKTTTEFRDTTDCAYLTGLVDDTRSTGTNAFALPDNGIYLYLDTDLGNDHMHFIVRNGGTDEHDTDLGSPPAGHSSGIIRVNDAGDEVELVFNGTIVATNAGILPSEQMQPYSMVLTRDSATPNKNLHVHDFRLIMDRGMS